VVGRLGWTSPRVIMRLVDHYKMLCKCNKLSHRWNPGEFFRFWWSFSLFQLCFLVYNSNSKLEAEFKLKLRPKLDINLE
jgi:hypothetical protein